MQLTDVPGPGPSRRRDRPADASRGPRFADRYDIVRTLKQGNGVATLLAVDCRTADQVVLKTFEAATMHAGMHARFVHETRVLSELSGVGLCSLHDAGQTDTHLYLAQQYVPGTTLEQVLRDGPLSVTATLHAGIAIAAALDLAHAAGVFHRDVKPANVIVDGLDSDGTFGAVTLIDFGFARSPWLDHSIRDELVGTVRYLSPEAAGLLPAQADERSDLYSFGVLLFECLVGRPPFDGASVGDVLRQHLNAPVPDLRTAPQHVPAALSAVVQRMLRKDPAERYQSAAAVGADLAQLLAALAAGETDPSVVIGRHDVRVTLTDPAFVGRESELATLTALSADTAAGRCGLVLLDADSGGGKSRLLTEATTRATDAGVAVLRGQGIALGGQRPFTLLHGVADDLVALLAGDPAKHAALRGQLADAAPAVVRALPPLAAVFGADAARDTGPEQFGELRSLGGLRRLLAAVGTAERPVLLVLDDCQWADALTVRLLAELFADPDQAPRHLSVVAAFRSEEVPADHPLRGIEGARTMHLGPLPARAVALLSESMAGPLPGEAIDTVVRLADGNPFMAAAVLRGLAESGAIVPGPDGWDVEADRLPDAQTARRSAAFLVRRLELLGRDALELLSVGAVLGKQFDIATAVRVAGGTDRAEQILEDARRRRLLYLHPDGVGCTFFHDKIREALLARLPDDERRALHGRAADALLAEHGAGSEAAFDLAYHLHAAGRLADALPHALAAAELARERYALDVAVTHYRMAAEAVEQTDADTRRRIAEGLGDVLMLQGSYGEATVQLSAARALVDAPRQAADLDGKLGALAFKQGDVPVAKARLEGALALLGRRRPGRLTMLPALLWELLVQAVHTLAPRLTTGRRAPEGHDADVLAMRLYSRLAYLYWFHSGRVACAWAHLRGMNLAERYPPSAELGQAWSEHAPVMTMLPWYARGVRYARRSFEIRRELGDVWGQGQSLNFTGVAQYAASQFAEAEAACEEAIRLLRRTGDQWEVNTASWTLALCVLRQGRLRECVRLARDTYTSAMTIGDRTAAGIALSIWARATDGRLPGELIRDELSAGSEDAQTTAELHLGDALVHRADGDLEAALESLQRAVRTVRDAGLRQEYIAPVFPWRATLLRELAEATPVLAPRLRARRIRAAARAGRQARRWSRSYRNNAAHALREDALLSALRGRRRRAERALRRSRQVALHNGQSYEVALTALAAAEIRLARDDSSAARDAYVAAVAGVQRFDPLAEDTEGTDHSAAISVFDRFATLLSAGRAIAAATTQPALEAAIRHAALSLLRAEQCHLVPAGALHDDTLTTRSGSDVTGVSRTLLLRAVEAGAPVVAIDEASGSTDSLLLSGIRSALAAPISVQGEATACLYVTHRHLGALFGEDEIQLAAFIATLAGAAYEHLHSSETRFRSLAQSSSDVTTLVGADGVVSYQSAAVGTVFGTPLPGYLGRPVTDWVHPEDVPAFTAALAAAADGGTGVRVECRFRHADGSYRHVESVVTDLLAEPTVGALVLNTRDITDRKLAVDQLRLVEERERIARDLHDVVIQRLFAVGLGLDSLSGRLEPRHAEQVVAATDELHQTIREIRGAIFSLRNDEPSRPLRERLEIVLRRGERILGFAPEVRLDPALDTAVPESVRWHLLASVNEALSNAAKHAGAGHVRVEVVVQDGELVAVVADDGRGLPADRHESGLVNLRHRAEVCGGSMTVLPGPDGTGLVLTWRVPLAG